MPATVTAPASLLGNSAGVSSLMRWRRCCGEGCSWSTAGVQAGKPWKPEGRENGGGAVVSAPSACSGGDEGLGGLPDELASPLMVMTRIPTSSCGVVGVAERPWSCGLSLLPAALQRRAWWRRKSSEATTSGSVDNRLTRLRLVWGGVLDGLQLGGMSLSPPPSLSRGESVSAEWGGGVKHPCLGFEFRF